MADIAHSPQFDVFVPPLSEGVVLPFPSPVPDLGQFDYKLPHQDLVPPDSDGSASADQAIAYIDGSEQQSTLSRTREFARHPVMNTVIPVLGRTGLLTSAVGTWIFEISPANEDFRGDVGVEVLQRFDNIILVGGAVGAITMAVETATGVLTAKTIEVKDGLTGKFNNWLTRNTEEMDTVNKDGTRKSDYILGLAGGSSPVVVERHRRVGGRTYEQNRKTAIRAAGGIALFSAALAASAGDFIQWGAENGYIEQTNGVMEGLKDWRTWVGVFAVVKTKDHLKNLVKPVVAKFKKPKEINETNVDIAEVQHEDTEIARRRKIKKYAAISAGVGAIALGVPGEILNAVSDIDQVQSAGGFLADNSQADWIAERVWDGWDWKIWTASFGFLLTGNKLSRFIANKRAQKRLVA